MGRINETREGNCTHILPIYHSEFGLSYTIAMAAGLQNKTGSTPGGIGGVAVSRKNKGCLYKFKERERKRERGK